MSELELAPDVFTADYVGTPGKRTFYLQARAAALTTSFVLEKGQVGLLAARIRDVLLAIDEHDTIGSAPPSRDPALAIAEPIDPQWRVGDMGLAYDDDTEMVVVLLEEVVTEEPEPQEEGGAARILLRLDQARSFALHALAIVGEGRPICQLCGLPMDPEGHRCPASNGHHVQAPG